MPYTRRNLCWGTEPRQLYDTVEGGEVKGYDDEVMKTLLRMYLREPRSAFDGMRPYLGERVMEDEPWEEMMLKMRRLYANPRDNPVYYGTPLWEKIYKKWFMAKID
jgi:small subunit ribosomal protein S30